VRNRRASRGAARLVDAPHVDDREDVVERQRPHHQTLARQCRQQAFEYQPMHGLMNGRAPDARVLDEVGFVECRARREPHCDDVALDQRMRAIGEAGGGFGGRGPRRAGGCPLGHACGELGVGQGEGMRGHARAIHRGWAVRG